MSDAFRPKFFIGSSSEGLLVAEELQLGLARDFDLYVWDQGVFGVGDVTLDRLLSIARRVDFAALCLTPDDVTDKRGSRRHSPRDNVIFEAGLFMGWLGRSRTFLVYCDKPELDLPSDLLGLTSATYPQGEIGRSVPLAATKIRRAVAQFQPQAIYSSADGLQDLKDEWRAGARGTREAGEDNGDSHLTLRRQNDDGEIVLWLTRYREDGSSAPVLRLEPLTVDRRVLTVRLEARTSAKCTFLIQLKTVDAPGGQYLGEKRFRLAPDGWRPLEASFKITTIDDFRIRLLQRSVSAPNTTLDVRRVSVVATITRS